MPRKKSTFGTVTKLKSGRWSARYNDPDGNRRSIKGTFGTEAAAWAALAVVRTDMLRGQWLDPDDGEILFADFAELVRQSRVGDLSPRTQQENVYMLNALNRTFGTRSLNKISPKDVALWWAKNADHPVSRRNKYGLLSNIMRTAVEWEYIAKSPVHVKNGFADVSRTRPTFTVEEFGAVVARLEPDLQRAVQVMFGVHLRISELCGLEWRDWNAKDNLLSIERQAKRDKPDETAELKTGEGGKRTITLMEMAVSALVEQQKAVPGIGARSIFRSPRGGRLRARYLANAWRAACRAEGVANFHNHDLRHISLTLVGQGTNSLKTVMARGGHSTERAALRYQSASRQADEAAARAADEAFRTQA